MFWNFYFQLAVKQLIILPILFNWKCDNLLNLIEILNSNISENQ